MAHRPGDGNDGYAPDPKLKFTFGLWTVGNLGRDPFGGPVREQSRTRRRSADLLGEVGAYGVNFHDNDLIPIDATARAGRADQEGLQEGPEGQRPGRARWRPPTSSPTRSSRTARSPATTPASAPTPSRRRCGRWTSGPSSAPRSTSSGAAARASRATPPRDPVEAIKRFREAINFLCEYSIEQKYGYKFAFEAKPNEPRGHMYFAVTGSYLALIPTLDHPEMCGVNPEVAHEHMAGLNFVHQVAARRSRWASCSTST